MRFVIKTAVLVLAVVLIAGPASAEQKTGRYAEADLAQRYKRANEAMRKVQEAFAKKDYELAKREAAAILATVPEHSEANFMMSKIAYIQKDYPTALGFMEKAKSTYTLMGDLIRDAQQDRLEDLRRRRNDQDAIISDLMRQLATAPVSQQDQIRLKIGQAERTREDIDKALNEAPMRTDERSAPPAYFFFHGNILLRLNRFPEAEKQYTEALRLNPAYGDAANNLASLHLAARDYEKALKVLTDVEANGGTVNPQLKADILRALGR